MAKRALLVHCPPLTRPGCLRCPQTHARFFVTGLIADTPPGAGFTLWPKTHTRLHSLAVHVHKAGLNSIGEEALALKQQLIDKIKVHSASTATGLVSTTRSCPQLEPDSFLQQ